MLGMFMNVFVVFKTAHETVLELTRTERGASMADYACRSLA